MTENKCERCGRKATINFTLKVGETETKLILCEPCHKKEITCQECKTQEFTTGTTKSDGLKVRVCEECAKKIQEVNQAIQKIKSLKEELLKYVEVGEHKLGDGRVIKSLTSQIKNNLTKTELIEFRNLLEANLTEEKAPTMGGAWGWKRGTKEIEDALQSEGASGIRQPYCYWLEVKKMIEKLEAEEKKQQKQSRPNQNSSNHKTTIEEPNESNQKGVETNLISTNSTPPFRTMNQNNINL